MWELLNKPFYDEEDGGGSGSGGGKEDLSGDEKEKGKDGKDEKKTVPYDRFSQVVGEKKKAEKESESLKSQIKKMQEVISGKDEKTKSEMETLQDQIKDLSGKWEASEKARMKLEVAGELGLPMELVDRLRGDNVEDLKKDGESLLELVKVEEPRGKGNPPLRSGGKGDETPSIKGKSASEIRKLRKDGKLSV